MKESRLTIDDDLIGMGPYLARHALEDVPLPEVIDFLRFLFAGQLFYVISLAMIKYTILAFYWRLFSLRARIPIFVGLFIVTAWALSIVSTLEQLSTIFSKSVRQ